jgi:hypothetical protein
MAQFSVNRIPIWGYHLHIYQKPGVSKGQKCRFSLIDLVITMEIYYFCEKYFLISLFWRKIFPYLLVLAKKYFLISLFWRKIFPYLLVLAKNISLSPCFGDKYFWGRFFRKFSVQNLNFGHNLPQSGPGPPGSRTSDPAKKMPFWNFSRPTFRFSSTLRLINRMSDTGLSEKLQ